MKRLFLLLSVVCCSSIAVIAQEQSLQETARTFMRTGDFDNAILILNRALEQDKNNLDLQKDLALAYYYKRDYAKALDRVKPMLDRDDADVMTY